MSDEPRRPLADLPEILTLEEAADVLRVRDAQLRVLIRDGFVPAFRLGPRTTRVLRDDLLEAIERSKVVGEVADGDDTD